MTNIRNTDNKLDTTSTDKLLTAFVLPAQTDSHSVLRQRLRHWKLETAIREEHRLRIAIVD